MNLLTNILNDAVFLFFLNILVYLGINTIYQRFNKAPYLHPLLLNGLFFMLLIELGVIKFESFVASCQPQSLIVPFLTISFALPLYRWRQIIFRHGISMLSGSVAGLFVSFFSVFILTKWLGLSDVLGKSMLVKSVTTPVAVELSALVGGTKELAAISAVVTGLVGYVFGPLVYKILHITDPIARGFSLGVASHVIGAAKAEDYSDVDVAAAGAAIGVFSTMTVIFVLIWSVII